MLNIWYDVVKQLCWTNNGWPWWRN